jgi:hypothetical protein
MTGERIPFPRPESKPPKPFLYRLGFVLSDLASFIFLFSLALVALAAGIFIIVSVFEISPFFGGFVSTALVSLVLWMVGEWLKRGDY